MGDRKLSHRDRSLGARVRQPGLNRRIDAAQLRYRRASRVLPAIQAPTLAMHRADDSLVSSACGRYLAENIARARFVSVPGADHSIIDNDSQDFVADQIEEFITGERHYH